MKLLLSSSLLMLLSTAAMAQYVENCQTHFSIQLEVHKYDDVDLGMCEPEEMVMLEKVVSDVAELDWIASQLGNPLGEFMVAYETYGPDVVIKRHGDKPPMEDLIPDNEEDLKFDLELVGCGDDDPDCLDLEEEPDRRRLALALKERLEQGNFEEFDYTPVPADTLDFQLRPVEFKYHRELMQHRRLYDCGTTSWCEGATWCCRFCPDFSHCRRRRERRLQDNRECVTVRTAGEQFIDEKAQKQIMKFEKRVSRKMTRELRRVARRGQNEETPKFLCLGNHKRLQARMDRHFFEEICEGDPNWEQVDPEEFNGTV